MSSHHAVSSNVAIDTAPISVLVCKNCDRSVTAGKKYCGDCGQKAETQRLTLHEISHDTLHALLHVDRSVLSLLLALTLRPGFVALEYVSGRRKRYYGPFAFLIVSVALAAGAIAVTDFPAVTSDAPDETAHFLQHHVNLLYFLEVLLIAACCRILVLRGPFNYAEFLVLSAYTAGMGILFFTVVNVGGWYLLKPSAPVARDIYLALAPVAPLYLGFACTQFLPGSKWLAFFKGMAAWAMSVAMMQGIVFAASRLIELITGR